MMLWEGVYHRKNSRFIKIFSISSELIWFSWLIHKLSPCTAPPRLSPHVPVTLVVGQLVLHYGNTVVITCSYGGANPRMYWQSYLQILFTYTWSSYSGHVSNSVGKTLKSCPWKSGGFEFWLVASWFIMKFFITNFF